MGLKQKLENIGSFYSYTATGVGNGGTVAGLGTYQDNQIITPNPLATSPAVGGLSLHATETGATYAAAGVSLVGNAAANQAQVNAAYMSYNDGLDQNTIPIPGNNPLTDLDLEGTIPLTNAHGNPNLLNSYDSQQLPYDQNIPN